MDLCVIGAGYVGLVSAACFAELGHKVICIDKDVVKIKLLKKYEIPIYEPGLSDLIKNNMMLERLDFSNDLIASIKNNPVILIAVGTPSNEDGSSDLKHVVAVAELIGQNIENDKVVIIKSTVPVGTNLLIKNKIEKELEKRNINNVTIDIVFNPEFLREGFAINDFMYPDRIVIGLENNKSKELILQLYEKLILNDHPILFMDLKSAELTKYASNSMLALRISFMNELASFCEVLGANIDHVKNGMGLDKRIGTEFLQCGLGYGGSCFPKDIKALISSMKENKLTSKILTAVEKVNQNQRKLFFNKILTHFNNDIKNKVLCLWGLAFKANTDDVRESPAAYLINMLTNAGAYVNVNDPKALKFVDHCLSNVQQVSACEDMYQTLENADALIIATDWEIYKNPDFDKIEKLLKEKTIFDGRNIFAHFNLKDLGWKYYNIGNHYG
ncbi:UDP-glucose/GDP-mannose dehydrogenase family protein [Spirobacillus cienkowskii]|uniref:UDP-glucose dehydrogenase family protein n=1 Tax=Spirobacillus cienkowskii TaxID=495820 RepID=UPI0030CE6C87